MSENNTNILSEERIQYYKDNFNKNLNFMVLGLKPLGSKDPNEAFEDLKNEFEDEFLKYTEEHKFLMYLKPTISEKEYNNERYSVFSKYFKELKIFDIYEE